MSGQASMSSGTPSPSRSGRATGAAGPGGAAPAVGVARLRGKAEEGEAGAEIDPATLEADQALEGACAPELESIGLRVVRGVGHAGLELDVEVDGLRRKGECEQA